MKSEKAFKINKIYLLFFIIGIVSACIVLYGRLTVEKEYKNYELTMDFEYIKSIAGHRNETLAESLLLWKDAGLNSVTLVEANIERLKYFDDFNISSEIRGYDLYLEGTKEGMDFVEKGFSEVLVDGRKIDRTSETSLVIEGKASDLIETKFHVIESKLEKVGLGYVEKDIELIKKSGLPLRLRPIYITSVQKSKESIDRFMSTVKEHSHQSYVMFYKDVFGCDDEEYDARDYLVEELEKNDISVVLIETLLQKKFIPQKYLGSLLSTMKYKGVRAFSTWEYIQKRYDHGIQGHHEGQEIMNAYFRAIVERNIRIIYVKPFLFDKNIPVTDIEIYKARFGELEERLAAYPHNIHGIKSVDEKIQTMPELKPNYILQMLSAFAAIAAFMMILDNLFDKKDKQLYILFAIALFCTLFVYLVNIRITLFNKLFALASIVFISVLTVQILMKLAKKRYESKGKLSRKKSFLNAILILLMMIVISMLGSFCEIAFYSESRFILEASMFRGVKISQLLPIFIVIIMSIAYYAEIIMDKSYNSSLELSKDVLNIKIKLWHLILGMILLGGLAIVLMKGSNESSIKTLDFQYLIRNFLERNLPARPRTKAILVGYTGAIMLYYYASQKKYRLMYPIFAAFAALGQANIFNTFSHIRTPVYLSVWRLVFEFIFAIILSILYLAIIDFISIHLKPKKRKNIEEKVDTIV